MSDPPCHLCADPGCAGHGRLAVHRVEHHARPWTTNAERAGSRYVRAALTREWRAAFAVLARDHRLPPMRWAAITVEPRQQSGRLQDVGACHPAVKAAVDGLVDAGVFPDDSADYVRTITYLRPVRGEPRLALWIMGETA